MEMPRRTIYKVLVCLFVSAFLQAATALSHSGAQAADDTPASIRQDVEFVLSEEDFQRNWPVPPKPQQLETKTYNFSPDWPDLTYLVWALIVVIGVFIVFAVIQFILQRDRRVDPGTADGTLPNQGIISSPLSSLSEIERLAQDGNLEEALHLLLLRFIEDIREQTRTSLQPAMTSREALSDVPLPDIQRKIFSRLIASVEHTHFGGRAISRATFEQCLEEYRSHTFSPAGTPQ